LISFNTQFLKQLGGLDESLEISQDYDLILRTVENTTRIVHIPDILYQWRRVEFSAGYNLFDRVMDISIDVLQRHLKRCGEEGAVYGHGFFNFFDTRYRIPKGVKVAIIIPTKNQYQLLKSCIESIEKTSMDIDFDIIVIDHQSDEQDTIDYLKSIQNKHQVIKFQGEFNFSKINNFAIKQLSYEYSHFLFCNNDIQAIEHNWLGRMMELFSQNDIAVVGAKLLYPDKTTIQHAGVNVGVHRGAEHYGKFLHDDVLGYREVPVHSGSLICNCEVLAVTAACMLVDSQVFQQVKGFDEELAVGFGDTDLCLKIGEAGYRVIFCPHAKLIHHESISRGVDNKHPEDTALFTQRWAKYMNNCDPYYNPNLSPESFSWEVQNPLPVYTKIKDVIN
jgi:GT2 family glycosyltransferase